MGPSRWRQQAYPRGPVDRVNRADGSPLIGPATFCECYDFGLSRFDGTTWSTLDASDGLTSDRVKSMDVGADGSVWFGTGINAGVYQRKGL